MTKHKPVTAERDIPLMRKLKQKYSVKKIQEAVAAAAYVNMACLRKQRRGKQDYARRVAIYLCRQLTSARGREIATACGLKSDSSLARLSREIDKKDALVLKVCRLLK